MISLVGLSPTLLMWMTFGGMAVISLLYLLRLRRRRVVVPYLPLWQKVVKQSQYQSLWQRFKRLLSWLFQVLLLLILLLALGNPRLRAELFSGRQVVVVLDTSASMQSTDLGKSRLVLAKDKVEGLIRGLVGEDRMMLVQMDSEVVPLTPFTSDKTLLRKRLKAVIPSDTTADLRRALLLAKDALEGRKRGEIIVISDAALGKSYQSLLVKTAKQKADEAKAASKTKPRKRPPARQAKDDPPPKGRVEGRTKSRAKPPKRRVRRRRRRRRSRKRRRRRRAKPPKRRKPIALPPGMKRRIDTSIFSRKSTVHRKLPRFQLIKVGKQSENVGIVALSARRLTNHPTQFSVYTEIHNFGKKPVTGLLELYVDSLIVETLQVQIAANQRWRHILPRLTAQGQRLEARLKVTKGQDLLPADNKAYAVLPKAKPVSVLLVSKDSLYLQAALLSDAQIIFKQVGCASPLPSKPFDVVIYNECQPKEEPTEGRFLFIGQEGDNLPFRFRKRRRKPRVLKGPIITDLKREHPVLRFVALKDLNISAARTFQLRKGDVALASSFGNPIFVTRETKTLRAAIIGFSLTETDMTLRMAFPLFLKNTIQWLMRGGRPLPPTARHTGRVWRIDLSSGTKQVTIANPKGGKITLPVQGGTTLFGGKYSGFYKLTFEGGERLIAANLSDPEESQIGPRTLKPTLTRQAVQPETSKDPGGLMLMGVRLPIPKPLWLYLLLGALVLFGVEWWTYNRRITV